MKMTIKNRKGLAIVAEVELTVQARGLAFILHGLGGHKEQPHILAIADIFKENNYSVVRFDATNALGESGGDYADASVTSYYDDLCDVIEWSASQPWHKEPFVLAGHSLGGIATALFADRFPQRVKAIAPLSTVVSWDLSKETGFYKENLNSWKEQGYIPRKHSTAGDKELRLSYAHVEDLMQYDLLREARNLTMPVLMVVGSEDVATPVNHQRIFFDALPGEKEIHIIQGSPHTFHNVAHLDELKSILAVWLKKIA